jgi:hypothetical protein
MDAMSSHNDIDQNMLSMYTARVGTFTIVFAISPQSCISSTTAANNALNKYLEASILSRPAFDWVTVSLRYEKAGFFSIVRLRSLVYDVDELSYHV